jgi:S1-C subfamily serine protease
MSFLRVAGARRLAWCGTLSLVCALVLLPVGTHAARRLSVPVTPCNASNLQGVVSCVEGSVLRLKVQAGDGESQGTGFVIQNDATGTYVLTNKHVVEGGTSHTTSAIPPNGGASYPVLAIVTEPGQTGTPDDLAVIKLPPTNLRPLAWGDSERLQVGQTVASIGYGLAFELAGPPSVTQGIISALHRDLGDGFGPAWIQHQSTINHGNSGGPLLDLSGNVVGVNTLSIDQLPNQSGNGQEPVQGMFFAIPSNTAQQVALRLIGQLQHHAARATITTFYATTKANYDRWDASATALPPTPISVFARGTQIVAFYFKYQGATPNVTTYQLIIRDSKGAAYFAGKVHPVHAGANEAMVSMDNGGSYDPGPYRTDLLIDGKVVASTPFTIGTPPSAARITVFYTTTAASYDAWGANNNYSPPKRTSVLPSGSRFVALYFHYQGATPKVTTYQITVRDAQGATYFTGKVHPFQNVANDHMSELDNGDPFANGTYHIDLLVNGKVGASATFTVGGSS